MESLEQAKLAVQALQDKKALDVKLLKVRDLTVLADYFVVASGTSNTHVGALADEVEFKLEQAGQPRARREGSATRTWILLDYGAVIVHVFYPETREFYDLEHLWADAQPVPLEG